IASLRYRPLLDPEPTVARPIPRREYAQRRHQQVRPPPGRHLVQLAVPDAAAVSRPHLAASSRLPEDVPTSRLLEHGWLGANVLLAALVAESRSTVSGHQRYPE